MVFKKGDPKTAEAGSKGAKNRKKPYYHFRELKDKDAEQLKEIQRRGGKNKPAL